MDTKQHLWGMLTLMLCLVSVPALAQVGIFTDTVDWSGNPDTTANPVHAEGSATESGGDYSLLGNGDDFYGNYDEGFYIYKMQTGSYSLSGEVDWLDPGADQWSKVGLMIREEPTNSQSRYYGVILRGGGGGANIADRIDFQFRSTTGGSTTTGEITDPDGQSIRGPIYLRVSRAVDRNMFVAEYSLDGSEWYVGHSTSFEMADNAAYGLAVTSHTTDDYIVEGLVVDVNEGPPEFILAERRISPGIFETQSTQDVTISIYNPGTASLDVAVTEIFPDGWTGSDASNGGTVSGNTITWDYSAPSGSSTITYRVATPENPTSSGSISGTAGAGNPITGFTTILYNFPKMKENMIEAPSIDREITLDGVMAAGEWDGAATIYLDGADQDPPGTWVSGGIDGPYPAEDYNATAYIFHTSQYIHVAVDVVDADIDPWPNYGNSEGNQNVWRWDSVELYLDGNLSRRNGSKDDNRLGPQMTVSANGAGRGGSEIAENSEDPPTQIIDVEGKSAHSENGTYWNYGASIRDDNSGYIVEYRLNKSLMLDPPDREYVGFDILMNGSDGGGNDNTDREHKWGWFMMKEDGTIGEYWNDEAGWGLLRLVGNTDVSEWALF
jgi:hypothetical protein